MPYVNFGDITPSQIQIFLAAAESENFSKAAQILNMTQPHVSHTVAQLEGLLGFPLFLRTGKKVHLTQAGRVLHQNWSGLFASVSQAIDLARQAHLQQNTGLVIADKFGLNKQLYLHPLLDLFKAAYGDIQISIEQSAFKQGVESVAAGNADLGFCLLSEISQIKPAGISWQVLTSQEFYAFVPPSSPLYSRDSVSPEDLAQVPIMLCNPSIDPHYNEDTLNIFRARGLTPVVHSYAKDGISLMLYRGLSDAVIILSPFIEETRARDLKRLKISHSSSSLVLYWNNSNKKENIARFISIAGRYFSQSPAPAEPRDVPK